MKLNKNCCLRETNSVVLVHCKKGISRSASTVIAYAMKEYGWSLEKSLDYVKSQRNCITPNCGFMEQLETFSGVLQVNPKGLCNQSCFII